MNKKSQIAVYLIFVLVAIATFMFITTKKPQPESPELYEIDTPAVRQYVENCMMLTGDEAINMIAMQGGYLTLESSENGELSATIPYYWDQGVNQVPELGIIELGIAGYMKTVFPYCLDNFSQFKDAGLTIETKEIKPTVNIQENIVSININMPTSIKSIAATKRLENYQITLDSHLGYVYESAKILVAEQNLVGNALPLSFYSNLADVRNFDFEIEYVTDNSIVVRIYKNDTNPLMYMYGLHYDWSDLEEEDET